MNYLRNLLSALAELPDRPIQAIVFSGKQVPRERFEDLMPYLVDPPIVDSAWDGGVKKALLRDAPSLFFQKDLLAERMFRRQSIDVVFQHGTWFGCRFGLPTLAWIADFQHRYLPEMFSPARFLKREIGYKALSHCATRILVSSDAARRDCEQFYPRSMGRISVLPFAVRIDSDALKCDPRDIRAKYGLPERFFFLPNQLWKHKNHMIVLEAVRLLREEGSEVIVVASGSAQDVRHPEHPRTVLDRALHYGLGNAFFFLGLIPYRDILSLMRSALGVINPSLFEGWSTTVEEAKAIGAPLILSDLPVHREQVSTGAEFFDPKDPRALAQLLRTAWTNRNLRFERHREQTALRSHAIARERFGRTFVDVVKETAVRHA